MAAAYYDDYCGNGIPIPPLPPHKVFDARVIVTNPASQGLLLPAVQGVGAVQGGLAR
ncbi:MAG: hypothetical protein ACRDJ9_11680 [Dehalococcoidia bacterium]